MPSHPAFRIRITHESYGNFLVSIRTLPDTHTARPRQRMESCFSGSDLPSRQLSPYLATSLGNAKRQNMTKPKQWK